MIFKPQNLMRDNNYYMKQFIYSVVVASASTHSKTGAFDNSCPQIRFIISYELCCI